MPSEVDWDSLLAAGIFSASILAGAVANEMIQRRSFKYYRTEYDQHPFVHRMFSKDTCLCGEHRLSIDHMLYGSYPR